MISQNDRPAYHGCMDNISPEALLLLVIAIGAALMKIPESWWKAIGGIAVLMIGTAMVAQLMQLLFR